jgi:hypothetical protein
VTGTLEPEPGAEPGAPPELPGAPPPELVAGDGQGPPGAAGLDDPDGDPEGDPDGDTVGDIVVVGVGVAPAASAPRCSERVICDSRPGPAGEVATDVDGEAVDVGGASRPSSEHRMPCKPPDDDGDDDGAACGGPD